MNFLLNTNFFSSMLGMAVLVLGILIIFAVIFVLISRLIVAIKYNRFKEKPMTNGLTAENMAKTLLAGMGMDDVAVVPCNFWTASFYGNSYSARKKTIRLRKNIYDSTSETAIAVATQKVALALQHKNNDKKFKVRAAIQPYIILAPIFFVPITLFGFIIDALLKTAGTASIIGVVVGTLFYVVAFIGTLFTLPVEKKANKDALTILETSKLANEEELTDMKSIFKAYEISYVADFVASLLYLIRFMLQILFKAIASKK